MKYSENANYQRYMSSYAEGDLVAAKAALLACASDFEQSGAAAHRADLLQRIGSIEHQLGDTEAALQCFRSSEALDPESLLVRIQFAKFLAEKVNDKQAALAKCDEIVSRARANPLPESESDYGSDEYAQMAEAIKQALV